MSLAIFFFFKILFTYSEGREWREGGREGGSEGGTERGREREKKAPCKEPAMGPEPKAEA